MDLQWKGWERLTLLHCIILVNLQGGQILRNAVTLGCLVQRSVRVVNVRGGRSKPGLRHQHLAGLRLIGQLCGGKLVGDNVNSTRVEFWPGSVQNGDYSADTQTAGSVRNTTFSKFPKLHSYSFLQY